MQAMLHLTRCRMKADAFPELAVLRGCFTTDVQTADGKTDPPGKQLLPLTPGISGYQQENRAGAAASPSLSRHSPRAAGMLTDVVPAPATSGLGQNNLSGLAEHPKEQLQVLQKENSVQHEHHEWEVSPGSNDACLALDNSSMWGVTAASLCSSMFCPHIYGLHGAHKCLNYSTIKSGALRKPRVPRLCAHLGAELSSSSPPCSCDTPGPCPTLCCNFAPCHR